MLLCLIILYQVSQLFSAPLSPSTTSCMGTGCKKGIHVFRVSLSTKPDDLIGTVSAQLKKKYGSNVFAPPDGEDKFDFPKARTEIGNHLPEGIDQRVKDRITSGSDFIIKPIDPDDVTIWVPEKDPLPNNFQQPTTSTAATPILNKGDPRLPIVLTALLVVAGVLLGMLCSCGIFAICSYSRKPVIDRSHMVVYRRPNEMELLLMEEQRKLVMEKQRRYMTRNSSAQSNASSRTPRAPPRRIRRDDVSRTTSRDSREPLGDFLHKPSA